MQQNASSLFIYQASTYSPAFLSRHLLGVELLCSQCTPTAETLWTQLKAEEPEGLISWLMTVFLCRYLTQHV